MKKEDIYTSTGLKFWKHPKQMLNYKKGKYQTIVSTHVSPEGRCNLNCSYCSVTYREKHERIDLNIIKDYVLKLKTAGLQAIIITGGGEPTLYPQINELLEFLKSENLKLGIITNGTNSDKIHDWNIFEWVRISINNFENWEERINVPEIKGTLGFSLIYIDQTLDFFIKALQLCDKLGGEYIRVLPDCLLQGQEFQQKHMNLDTILDMLRDNRFFHQHKYHCAPRYNICHQSYFRPYLSEVDGGTVFPCDSLVLNNANAYFSNKYKLCRPHEILKYLKGQIKATFNPIEDCKECVFTHNVNMLGDWKYDVLESRFEEIENMDLKHEEFI